jgi:predicted O-methyltransferase YrrM
VGLAGVAEGALRTELRRRRVRCIAQRDAAVRTELTDTRRFGRSRDAVGRVLVRIERALERDERIGRGAREVGSAPRSLDEAIDYVYSTRPGGLKLAPNQVRSELRDFLLLAKELNPRAVVEIGTALGGTLFLLTRVAAPDAVLVSVDLSSPRDLSFGGGNVARRGPFYEAFALDDQRVHFIAGDSHDAGTRAAVEQRLDGREADLLFIDGDHSEVGVAQDYELYRDLVREGGLIAFHDIVEGPPELVGGVPSFWRKVKTAGARELVADPGQGGYGIGVLGR